MVDGSRQFTDPRRFRTTAQESLRRKSQQELRLEKYRTYKHYERGIEAARRYRGWVERKTTRRDDRGGAFVRFGRGVAMAPAGLIEYGAVIPPAFERAAREPRKTVEQALPGLAASVKGAKAEFKKRPYEFGGELAGQALLTYGLERGIDVGTRQLTKISPRYVPARKITPTQYRKLPKTGVPSTERVPISTTAAEIQKIFRESKYTKGGEIVYHAAPQKWKPIPGTKDIYKVAPGKSPTKALYTAPEAYTPFAVRAVKRTWKPSPDQPTPTFYRIKTKGVELPKMTKGKAPPSAIKPLGKRIKTAPKPKQAAEAYRAYKAFVESEIKTGKAYVSPEAAAPIPWRGKLEVEATIGAAAKLKGVGKRKFTYVKVPSYNKKGKFIGYETIKIGVEDVELLAGLPTVAPSKPVTKVTPVTRVRRGAVIEVAPRVPRTSTIGISAAIIRSQRTQRESVERESKRVIMESRRVTQKMKRDLEPTRKRGVVPPGYTRDIDRIKREYDKNIQPPSKRRRIPPTEERPPDMIERPIPAYVKPPTRRVPPVIKRPPPMKEKPPTRKKKYEEDLRKYEEELKKYDPEAWIEKRKIPTLEELLGKR